MSGENLANENGESRSNQAKRSDEAKHAAPITRTIVEIPNSILEEYRRAQKQQEADNRRTQSISLAAVAIAGFVALVGIWQGVLSRTNNQTTQQGLTLSERPWVSLDLKTLTIVDHSLTFNPKGGFIAITGEMQNTGHSVAMHTQSDILIMDWSQLPKGAEMHTAQLCHAPISPDQSVGYILFPGDRAPVDQGAEFYPKDIAYALAHPFIKDRVMPLAIICIQYQSVFEQKYHLTQYVFNLLTSKSIGAFEPKGSILDLWPVHVFFGDLAY